MENKSISTNDLYRKFSTKSDGNDIFGYAVEKRAEELNKMSNKELLKNGINEAYLRDDDARIIDTIKFLINSRNDNFEFYINSKPLTRGCDEALKYRLNPLKALKENSSDIFGVGGEHETKSMVMENNNNIYYFIMPGNNNLNNDIVTNAGLSVANLSKYGVVAYTFNPATVMSLSDKGKTVNVFIDQGLEKPEFLCNNLGSRFLSYTVNKEHSCQAIENLALQKGIELKTYDGSFKDFMEKSGLGLEEEKSPSKSVNLTGVDQIRGGDYQKNDGSGRFNF